MIACPLCERSVEETTEHHLTPKEEGGTHLPTVGICIPCHKQIHALYSNKELARRLNALEKLRADEVISKYIKWIRKQPYVGKVKTKRSNHKTQTI